MRVLTLHQDMLLLKWPTLVLVIAILASSGWCGGAYLFREGHQRALQVARGDRQQLQSSVLQIEDEARTVRGFIDRYRQLETDGVIGAEDRLELVETVGHIRARHMLYPVQLDIEQQAVLPPGQDGGLGNQGAGLSLRLSKITMNLPLLHEEDLSHLLDGLSGIRRGILVTEECAIKRTGSELGTDRPEFRQNLTASCKLLWLTMQREEGQR